MVMMIMVGSGGFSSIGCRNCKAKATCLEILKDRIRLILELTAHNQFEPATVWGQACEDADKKLDEAANMDMSQYPPLGFPYQMTRTAAIATAGFFS